MYTFSYLFFWVAASILWYPAVNKPPIIHWFPNTFYPILGHHQWCVYCKSDVSFACTLLLWTVEHLLFILVCSFFLIWSALRICNFCLLFCCSNIVVFPYRKKLIKLNGINFESSTNVLKMFLATAAAYRTKFKINSTATSQYK